jgi:CheY-like chemotaxis protein
LALKSRTEFFLGFDLPLTDQTMPEMTGTQLAHHVLAMKNFMPIIVCTGLSETITDQNALNFGIAK